MLLAAEQRVLSLLGLLLLLVQHPRALLGSRQPILTAPCSQPRLRQRPSLMLLLLLQLLRPVLQLILPVLLLQHLCFPPLVCIASALLLRPHPALRPSSPMLSL